MVFFINSICSITFVHGEMRSHFGFFVNYTEVVFNEYSRRNERQTAKVSRKIPIIKSYMGKHILPMANWNETKPKLNYTENMFGSYIYSLTQLALLWHTFKHKRWKRKTRIKRPEHILCLSFLAQSKNEHKEICFLAIML